MDTDTKSGLSYAGFWRRFLAYWVDFIIVLPIGLIIQTMFGVTPLILQIDSLEQLHQFQSSGNYLLTNVISLVLAMAYHLIMWVNYDGATPGKKLLAIKVVKTDGTKLSYPVGIIRYLGYFVSAFSLGLGFLWTIWDKKKQAWHDKIAGTVVVKTDAKPKTFVAIVLLILAFLLFFGYLVSLVSQVLKVSSQQNRTPQAVQESLRSFSTDVPVGNPHWDKAQELFGQMRTANEARDTSQIFYLQSQIADELNQVLKENPDNPRVWAELGHSYSWVTLLDPKLGEKGLAAYQKAADLDPSNPIYTDYVADQLMLLGRNDEAVLQLQKSVRLNPAGSGFTNMRLGQAYQNLKLYDQAKNHYQQAIDLFTAQNKDGQFDDEILNAQKALSTLPQ